MVGGGGGDVEGSVRSHRPKVAPSRSEDSTPRPLPSVSGPTATVPLRSRIRAAATFASSTEKYGVQATATWNAEETAKRLTTGT